MWSTREILYAHEVAFAAGGRPVIILSGMDIVVSADGAGVSMAELDRAGRPGSPVNLTVPEFVDQVREMEEQHPRWVWAETSSVYPGLLRAGVTVARAQDLRLCHALLARSTYVIGGSAAADDLRWGAVDAEPGDPEPSLLDLPVEGVPLDLTEVAAEHGRQQAAVAASVAAGRLRLLLAAESAGALVAAELTAVGLPFDETVHHALLSDLLGPQPLPGGRPGEARGAGGTDPDRAGCSYPES